jgi:Mrp family chromosome partitioning ATPase
MGKIFEALEKAQRERQGRKSPPLFVVPSPGERPAGGFDIAAEHEMVTLSRNIDALLETSPRKVIQFIGPHEGAGTSTVVRDFAMVSAARLGRTVLLLDADPLSPSQHLFFHLQPKSEWEEIVRDKVTFDEAIHKIGDTDLYVLPNPPGSTNVPKILYSPEIREFWEELRKIFDLVLIDSAPASASPDGIGISRYVDGVVLVLSAEKTRKPVAESLKYQIVQNGGNLLGMVFNNRRYHIPESVYKRL